MEDHTIDFLKKIYSMREDFKNLEITITIHLKEKPDNLNESCTLSCEKESYNFYEEHKRWLEKQPAFTWKPEPKRPDSPQQMALARVERRIAESIAERDAGWNLMDACSNHVHWLD